MLTWTYIIVLVLFTTVYTYNRNTYQQEGKLLQTQNFENRELSNCKL